MLVDRVNADLGDVESLLDAVAATGLPYFLQARRGCGLTARELELLPLIAEGLRNAEIAERLVLAPKTVDHHMSAVLRKLNARTRTEAVTTATGMGILSRAS